MTVKLTFVPDRSQSLALLDFCAASSVTRFTAAFLYSEDDSSKALADYFLVQLSPFEGGSATLEKTVYLRKRYQEQPFYLFTEEARGVILKLAGDSLLSYDLFQYPEDWTFYRDSDLFFGIISHEQTAFFRFSDDAYARFQALGFAHAIEPTQNT